MFETEELMAQKFSEFLEKRIVNKSIDYVTELLGVDGIPDCVVFEKTNKNIKYVISYELMKEAGFQDTPFIDYSSFNFQMDLINFLKSK